MAKDEKYMCKLTTECVMGTGDVRLKATLDVDIVYEELCEEGNSELVETWAEKLFAEVHRATKTAFEKYCAEPINTEKGNTP